MVQNIMVVDLDRCIGCKGCQVACKLENNVALGASRNKILTIGPTGSYPNLEMYFLMAMCQQCEDPSCVKVCPTGACYKRNDDGVIVIDSELCMGCQSCLKACPYEVNYFNKEMRVSDKCTLCSHLVEANEMPACVKNCSGRALIFGDINDPESEVSKVLREAGEDAVYQLRDTGNQPSVRYILRHSKWVDILPQECQQDHWRSK